MADGVTSAIRQLTDLGVSRLEHLEVLLVMARQPEREWDAARIAANSPIRAETAGEALTHLHKRGLLDLARPEPPGYRLGARLDLGQLTQLRKDYERDRTTVMNTFFTCNLDSLRSFASAFRIRRPT